MTFVENKDYPLISLHVSELGSRLPGVNVLEIVGAHISDSTNVPLVSDRAPKRLTAGIDWQYQSCPFQNSISRYPDGKPHETPISGLERKRLQDNYPRSLSIVKVIRDTFVANTRTSGENNVQSLNALEMRGILRALSYFPHYLTLRASNPIPARGALPPEIVVLSNAAAGTLGSLEAYLGPQEDPAFLRMPPKVEEMIMASEELGTMVGDKTVCVASPEQMRHFISYIVNGDERYQERFDITPFFTPDKEIAPLCVFGQETYLSHTGIEKFRMLDSLASEDIKRHIKKRHNPRRIRSIMNEFSQLSKRLLHELNQRQEAVNMSLGRRPRDQITLDMFEAVGFKMPAILRNKRF